MVRTAGICVYAIEDSFKNLLTKEKLENNIEILLNNIYFIIDTFYIFNLYFNDLKYI